MMMEAKVAHWIASEVIPTCAQLSPRGGNNLTISPCKLIDIAANGHQMTWVMSQHAHHMHSTYWYYHFRLNPQSLGLQHYFILYNNITADAHVTMDCKKFALRSDFSSKI